MARASKTPWFLETRPQFLLLSVVLVAHGATLALWQGSFDWLRTILAAVGLVLLHASVNVLNDWHDNAKTGIDERTRRTPFSGGSGLVTSAAMSAGQALSLGMGLLVAGSAIGLYLAWLSGWQLLAIGVIGAISVVAYTPLFNRIGAGEIAAGFTLGTLPVVGTYFLLTGRIDPIVWVSATSAGLLTYNLLLLNEFPDAEADAVGGRRHMVILLGKKSARWLYVALEVAVYLVILAGVIFARLTPWALLSMGGSVFAAKAIAGAITSYDRFAELVPAQGANVIAVLSTNALLAIGFAVAAFT
jgi:1,4-dihydroxy-2-naphthoate octaprenyltransferase